MDEVGIEVVGQGDISNQGFSLGGLEDVHGLKGARIGTACCGLASRLKYQKWCPL